MRASCSLVEVDEADEPVPPSLGRAAREITGAEGEPLFRLEQMSDAQCYEQAVMLMARVRETPRIAQERGIKVGVPQEEDEEEK